MAVGSPITFVVSGTEEPSVATRSTRATRGRVKHAVRVGATRGDAASVTLQATPGEDVVILHIADGPELVLHPENARDLLQAQAGGGQRAGRTHKAAAGDVEVPVRLQWSGVADSPAARGATRGVAGVLLSKIEVVSPALKDDVADWVASSVVKAVDGQVDAGLYQLSADRLSPLKGQSKATPAPSADGSPLLVLVHGTFSTTAGTFGQLWVHHPDQVRALFKQYGGRVYGLDHPTLGVSPIANALTLAEALPGGEHVHLLTHSRGGLVAEVLARVCGDPDDDFAEFAGRAYQRQRSQLRELAAIVKRKALRVDRVVRVACPARGTLLASKRVDAFVSVFKWTLELAGLPVAAELVDFLDAVARHRADPSKVPGLAAQIPDSPLIRWLHAVDRPIDGQLRVVAGDLQPDSVTSWLKTLLTDAFYWTDHDLVVQTRSMYGGSPRRVASTFVLDQGGKVSHFTYFSNARTAQAIATALLQETPQDFTVIGPLSWAGQATTGTRARLTRSVGASAERPAVFILPGMFGSNLKVGSDRVWVSWQITKGLETLQFARGRRDRAEPDGMVGSVYDNLSAFFSKNHDAIEFPFDWRQPIEVEARRLATALVAALDARKKSGQPVHIIAHSMGGLVARAVQLERPDVWTRLMAHEACRVLLLGVPNGGSYAPMQVLSGDETLGNLLSWVGPPFAEHATRAVLATFPGFLQLQAGLLDTEHPLGSAKTWQQLGDEDWARATAHSAWHRDPIQLDALRWGVPPQHVLDAAVALRRRLDAQRTTFEAFSDRVLVVVGQAPSTPDRFEMTDAGLVYSGSALGDGRVTLENAMLPGIRAWRVPCEHAELPRRKDAFDACLQLLQTGSTQLLESVSPAPAGRTPSIARAALARPARGGLKATPPRSESESFEALVQSVPTDAAAGPSLRVTIHNGDLTFVQHPLLLGHYRSARLTGTEAVMNRWIGEAMEQSLRVGTYPDGVGTHQIFLNRRANPDNPWQLPRPEAVIVVGLGDEAKLRGADLVRAVRQGVLAWAERQAERPDGGAGELEIAATLIGSGGQGISAGQSAQLVAQGVSEANARLWRERSSDAEGPERTTLGIVTHLHLIELYLDRASEALHALRLQEEMSPGTFDVTAVVAAGIGGLERPIDASYRGADYDFISARTREEGDGSGSIEFTLDTKRARTEVHAQRTQSALVGNLVALASNDANTDTRIGRTLFQLLIPIEIEPYLAGATEMLLEVDQGTAGIPWELLDADKEVGDASSVLRQVDRPEPWAIRAKLLRKLRIDDPPERRDAGADGGALVIGEPKCDIDKYPRLIGARLEARQVADCLASSPRGLGSARVQRLISPDDPTRFGPDSRDVLNAIFDRDRAWRIVHIAGHGEPAVGTDPGGVVLSEGFLTAKEIGAMRVVPELVFVNCCHLAARSGDQLLRGNHDRARFAAGVAEALIRVGVRCVVAAGWAVDDAAANAFASRFYVSLLEGRRFLDAANDARKAAYACGGNTWSAYQCYGDPDWTFTGDPPDAQGRTLDDQFEGIVSASSLRRALATLAVQNEFQGASLDRQRDRIRFLENKAAQTAPEWLRVGSVAEALGRAWATAGDFAAAIRWYEAACAASDGSASLKAVEQLANLKARIALAADREGVHESIRLLEHLLSINPTIERENLCGSAYKRLALIESAAGHDADAAAALTRMKECYGRALERAERTQEPDVFYPAQNLLLAELAANIGTPGWSGLDPTLVEQVRTALALRAQSNPDFWSIAGLIELRLYEALAGGTLAQDHAALLREFSDLRERVASPQMWSSVYDQFTFVLRWALRHTSTGERNAAESVLKFLRESGEVPHEAPAALEEPAARVPRRRKKKSAAGPRKRKPRR